MVYFVGAGPGDVELITVKGKKLLSCADIIIYAGSLVNPKLLEYAKSSCKFYNSANMTLEEVMDVILKDEHKNLNIVRLHTGDPSIYGAIAEQMDILNENNVKYEVVPGVSSFFGAAASLKTEYTLPGVSQTVILTRMEGITSVPKKEDIVNLAKINGSMVIFLSTGMLKKLSEKLIEGGYDESTPAAIAYKVTWEDEKIIRTTIKNLQSEAEKAGIKKTALILVGDFLKGKYERSMLYSPEFSHEFREKSKGKE